MHIKSLYPEVPSSPDTNAHIALLRRSDQAEWPEFAFHVDAQTGKTRTFRDFVQRVQYAATALGAPVSQGGLGLSPENGDIVGIMSFNCMVSTHRRFLRHSCLTFSGPKSGLHHPCPRVPIHSNSIRAYLRTLEAV
jgi:hypothetical protein